MIKVALSIYWYVFHTFVSKQINIDFIFICMGKTNKSQYSDNLHLYSSTFFLLQFSIIAKAKKHISHLLSSDVLKVIVVSFPPPFAVNA